MADELTNCEKLDYERIRKDDPVEAMERLIGIDPPLKKPKPNWPHDMDEKTGID